jgi:hypothetical protein
MFSICAQSFILNVHLIVEHLILEDGVNKMESSSFQGFSALRDVVLPETISSIGYQLFADCSNLSSILLPDSLVSIGLDAFKGCDSLTHMNFGPQVSNLNSYWWPPALAVITVNPGNLNFCSDDDGILWNRESTTLLFYPPGKTNTRYVFTAQVALRSIILPDSLSICVASVFRELPALTSLHLGAAFPDWTSNTHW